MGRAGNVIVLIVYLLTVPAGVFFYFTSPGMGYPKSTAGIIAGVLALVGLALLPVALRGKPTESAAGGALPAKAGWGVLIGFLAPIGNTCCFREQWDTTTLARRSGCGLNRAWVPDRNA